MLRPDFDRLLAAARRGEDPAWAQLYGQFAGPLLGYLGGQGADDAEDLVGEVFLAVVRGLPRFAGDEAGFRASASNPKRSATWPPTTSGPSSES